MIDDEDQEHILFVQSLDRLQRVARRYPDPLLVLDEWWYLVVANCLDRRASADIRKIMRLCAAKVAFDAEFYAPDDAEQVYPA